MRSCKLRSVQVLLHFRNTGVALLGAPTSSLLGTAGAEADRSVQAPDDRLFLLGCCKS